MSAESVLKQKEAVAWQLVANYTESLGHKSPLSTFSGLQTSDLLVLEKIPVYHVFSPVINKKQTWITFNITVLKIHQKRLFRFLCIRSGSSSFIFKGCTFFLHDHWWELICSECEMCFLFGVKLVALRRCIQPILGLNGTWTWNNMEKIRIAQIHAMWIKAKESLW